MDIQGMRGVAVLLVVLSHAGVAGFDGGFVGVDVFFVLSGFLITGVLVKEAAKEDRLSIARFYGNRAKRILPAATLTLLATAIAGNIILNYVRADQLYKDTLASAFFVSNWRFAAEGTDYFAQNAEPSAVQHFWSLAVEEQFYLVWPLLIGLVFLGHQRSRRLRERREKRLGIILAVVAIGSLAWSVHQTDVNATLAYFSTLTRVWELSLGALLAVFASRVAALPDNVKAILGWGGLVAVVGSLLVIGEGTPFPGYAALLPVLGTAAVLAGGTDGPAYGVSLLLRQQPLRYVGDISYSLYLWHWPLLVLGAAALDKGYADLGLAQAGALVAIAFVLAAVSYRWIENPVRSADALREEPVKATALWPASFAVLLVPLLLMHTNAVTAPQEQAAQAQAQLDSLAASASESAAASGETLTPLDQAVAAAEQELEVGTFSPPVSKLLKDTDYLPSACRSADGRTENDICNLGAKDGTKTVVIMGDSTAAMYMPGLVAAAKANDWKLIPLIKYICPSADIVQLNDDQPYTECGPWRTWALDQLDQIKPDLTLLAGLTNLELTEAAGKPTTDSATGWQQGLAATIEKVRPVSGAVSTVAMLPRPKSQSPVDCLAGDSPTMDQCSFPIDPLTATVQGLTKDTSTAEQVGYLDFTSWVCQDDVCPEVIGETAVWSDGHHISATWSIKQADALAEAIKTVLPPQ